MKMKNLIYIVTLYGVPLFFGTTVLFGVPFVEGESNSMFRLFCIVVFGLSMSLFILDEKLQLKDRTSILTFFAVVYYIFVGYSSGYTNNSKFLSMIAFSLPATCAGLYYANDKKDNLFKLAKWMDVIFVILSVCVILLTSHLSVEFEEKSASYSQRVSYYSSLCFLLDIFLLFYGNHFKRFRLFRESFIKYIYYFLLPVFIVIILFSGGRGGMVVVAVGIMAIILLYNKFKHKSLLWGIATAFFIFTVISQVTETASLEFTTTLDRNSDRVFSYVTDEGIDVRESSGRDIIYLRSWQLFLRRPLMGYGLFKYDRYLSRACGAEMPYPHNLFLEWLLQGGILLFSIWLFVFIKAMAKLHRLIKSDVRYMILLPPLVYIIVLLMFSGSYLGHAFFWFSISFLINKSELKSKKTNQLVPSTE